jgi:8-amino-7-oxononanoate synthase
MRADAVSLTAFCEEKLSRLEAQARRRGVVDTTRLPGGRVQRQDRVLVDVSSNDALGLSFHPVVQHAARDAIRAFGTGAGGSRLVSGNHPLFRVLEEQLARLKGCEASLVVSSGYLANLGVIPALVGEGDVIVIDALAHACLMSGSRLSGARIEVVAHNDADAFTVAIDRAADEVATRAGHVLVVTESVFSMDGDGAPLDELAAACRTRGAWLLVDDAHGFLVSPDAACTGDVATVITGTLSKATASVGGSISGPRALIALLQSRARPFVFSTGLPPAAVAAASAAIEVAVAGGRALMGAPLARARRLCAALDLPTPSSHIVPIVVGDERRALALMHGLVDDGFLAVAIRPPTVPAGTSRLRLSFSAAHSDDDVDALAVALRRRLLELS